ncbi:cation transporter [Trypanosoma conorhini]|uniref:Cation transporter n=1 Tax=Trypanosoma conorhini TaxID=83891 RepID=A0A3R7M468_9TRYP|nr:cation transporter [Trypanosoma conorhini]RNF08711.1 cation transporter [Trypanosoma conorhini]
MHTTERTAARATGHVDRHHHGGCSGEKGPYSAGLHVMAIFVVLAASLVGTLIPLAGKYVPCLRLHPFMFVLGKCAATGVVLAVAMIHMINHAAHAFGEECVPDSWKQSYDAYAFLFAMIAAILMHALETQLVDMFVSSEAPSSPLGEGGEKRGVTEGEERADGAADVTGDAHHHSHVVVPVSGGATHRLLSALFMEFGVTLHSVFIGLTVGITNDAGTKALLVALVFHQMFEGLALGSRLADASMRMSLELLLALIFSISAPVGTAVGVGAVVGSKVAVTGTTFVVLQAIFDSLCGGILMYLGFVLMLSDFPADLRKHAAAGMAHRGWKRLAMFVALWAGAGIMAGIGKWL